MLTLTVSMRMPFCAFFESCGYTTAKEWSRFSVCLRRLM
jgi:hypothetical protein